MEICGKLDKSKFDKSEFEKVLLNKKNEIFRI